MSWLDDQTMSYIDDQLMYASEEDLEAIFAPRKRRNPFKPVKEIQMSEQRTRVEIVQALAEQCKMMSAMGEALTMLLLQDVVETTVIEKSHIADEVKERMKRVRAARKPKTNGTATVEMLPANPPTPGVPPPVMPDVVPVKPTKGLADLRTALQDCITKHGMPEAKERLAPYLKVSEVPDEAIEKVIGKLGE
jgi:hypothetical protein